MRSKVPGQRVKQELVERVEQLEADIAELRRHHVRVAELADMVQELLVPLADRDDERVAAAIEKFQEGL